VKHFTQVFDATKGRYWNLEVGSTNFRYRDIAPLLWKQLGTNSILWCCTSRDNSFRNQNLAHPDRTEWEIEIPFCDVLVFIRASKWEDALSTGAFDWSLLAVYSPSEDEICSGKIDAIVGLPLATARVTRLGLVPLENSRPTIERR